MIASTELIRESVYLPKYVKIRYFIAIRIKKYAYFEYLVFICLTVTIKHLQRAFSRNSLLRKLFGETFFLIIINVNALIAFFENRIKLDHNVRFEWSSVGSHRISGSYPVIWLSGLFFRYPATRSDSR